MSHCFVLTPGQLSYQNIQELLKNPRPLCLAEKAQEPILKARALVEKLSQEETPVYGVNTGFGLLAHTRIDVASLEELQKNIVYSHAAGTGDWLSDDIVRLILLLKINSLARGYSGISLDLLHALMALYNHHILPCIPSKGSVGASGDLAPLAHLSLTLIGEGLCRVKGEVQETSLALKTAGLSPYSLKPKEGLSLLNGTQVSTALALYHLIHSQHLLKSALIIGALSVDAALGSDTPFDARIHALRLNGAQGAVAARLHQLLQGSDIRASHRACSRVQDPYSLRCQPQVMGACLTYLEQAEKLLTEEANAVTDNPLVFVDTGEILSGGNFHAEPVAITADLLAICLCEIANISERRIALLTDPHHNQGLPAFLVKNPGIHSGFMLAQVTASALVSENKTLAHPASIDSIPTSANQEDHVSMATFAARRLGEIADNVLTVLAIELLSACQGIDLREPLKSSAILMHYHELLRARVPFYEKDRYFAPDIAKAKTVISAWNTDYSQKTP